MNPHCCSKRVGDVDPGGVVYLSWWVGGVGGGRVGGGREGAVTCPQ